MRRAGPKEWTRLIAEYQQGEISQKEFVAKHDLSFNTFQYWLYKRSKLNSNFDVNSPPHFLPVEVVGLPASKTRVEGAANEAVLRSGTVLRFAVSTDMRYLAELFAAIE